MINATPRTSHPQASLPSLPGHWECCCIVLLEPLLDSFHPSARRALSTNDQCISESLLAPMVWGCRKEPFYFWDWTGELKVHGLIMEQSQECLNTFWVLGHQD